MHPHIGILAFLVQFTILENAYTQNDHNHAANQGETVVETDIRTGLSGNLEANVVLEGMFAGTTQSRVLRIHNPFEEAIPIRSMSTTCNCLAGRTDDDEIPPGGSVDFAISIDVPRGTAEPTQHLLMTIFYEQKSGITVKIRYEIAGLASFLGSGFVTKAPIGAKEHEFEIPLIITEPLKLSDVSVLADDSLGLEQCELVERNGKPIVQCRLKFDPTETGRNGVLMLVAGSLKNHLPCIVGFEHPILVVPSVLQFVPTDDDGPYVATAIVKLHDSLFKDTKKKAFVEFEANTTGELSVIKQEEIRMAEGVYRLKWEASLNEADESKSEETDLKLRVRVNNEVLQREVEYVLRSK